jgi:mono/diheme cytochrome c family protein
MISSCMTKRIYPLLIVFTLLGAFSSAPKVQTTVSATPLARTASQNYGRYCVACHGRDGKSQTSKGKFSHARDLTDAKWQDDVTDERLFNSIMNGRNVRGNMPGFKDKIKENDVEALVDMVRKFRK